MGIACYGKLDNVEFLIFVVVLIYNQLEANSLELTTPLTTFIASQSLTAMPPLSFAIISESTAHVLSILFATSYIGSLYVFQGGRLLFHAKNITGSDDRRKRPRVSGERWRDDDVAVKARLLACCISTAISCGVVFWLIWQVIGFYQGVDITLFH